LSAKVLSLRVYAHMSPGSSQTHAFVKSLKIKSYLADPTSLIRMQLVLQYSGTIA